MRVQWQPANNLQIDNGRVIIDAKMWSTYNPDLAPHLEAFDAPSSDVQLKESGRSFPDDDDFYEDTKSPYGSLHHIIRTMQRGRGGDMEQRRRSRVVQDLRM